MSDFSRPAEGGGTFARPICELMAVLGLIQANGVWRWPAAWPAEVISWTSPAKFD
jgi:hypothetical protein